MSRSSILSSSPSDMAARSSPPVGGAFGGATRGLIRSRCRQRVAWKRTTPSAAFQAIDSSSDRISLRAKNSASANASIMTSRLNDPTSLR